MTPEDLARVHGLAFVYDRAWTIAEFASLLSSKGVILCGDARSFLLGRVVADEAEVLTVATNPAFQRNGLARGALTAFEVAASAQSAERVFLEVATDNAPAKALYFNAGFTQIAERPRYYARANGDAVAALILQKQL